MISNLESKRKEEDDGGEHGERVSGRGEVVWDEGWGDSRREKGSK
jgi:hypothetical protein